MHCRRFAIYWLSGVGTIPVELVVNSPGKGTVPQMVSRIFAHVL